METQACRRLGPGGRSLPEHFYWRYCDWSCKPENRGTTGWPAQLLQQQIGLRACISIVSGG
eukprot:7764965-Alexandrium_andersonii.AAC.1